VLLGLWALGYFVLVPLLPPRAQPRVQIRPATVVGLVPEEPRAAPPEPVAVDPVFKELVQPMEQARKEWMKAMAQERFEMIERAYQAIDAVDPEGRPPIGRSTNEPE
jgi:hypothetical protein